MPLQLGAIAANSGGGMSMAKIDSRKLGSYLKRLREERKLTLGGVETLSEGLGERINKTYLFRVERGTTVPTIPRLQTLGKVYRLKMGTLLEILEGSLEEQQKEAELDTETSKLSFEDLRARGIDAERGGDFARASIFYRVALERTLSEEPSRERSARLATARLELSIALKCAGRHDLAREEAELALEDDDIPVELQDRLRLHLAVVCRRLGRSFLSREILTGLLARKGAIAGDILAGTYMGIAAIQLAKQPREAARHYRSALTIIKNRKDTYNECILLFDVALAEAKAGNFERAFKSLNKARDIARRKDYNFWVAKIQTEIGKTHFLKGDRRAARSALHDANDLARRRDYFVLLFLNNYYFRCMALEEGDGAAVRAVASSLKYFATRCEESFEELEVFKREMGEIAVSRKGRP